MADALRALEADADTTPVGSSVPLVTDAGEFEITVPPPGKWRTRANRVLRDGDFDGWAELVLSGEDFDSWVEADPTNDDVEAFFKAWADVTGETRGKSGPSSTSSRNTRRR